MSTLPFSPPTQYAAWEPTINAFQDGTRFTFMRIGGETGTAIHEFMHLFENHTFTNGVSWNTHEGATEYFARFIYAQQKITRVSEARSTSGRCCRRRVCWKFFHQPG